LTRFRQINFNEASPKNFNFLFLLDIKVSTLELLG
jgi:hypothetical protein